MLWSRKTTSHRPSANCVRYWARRLAATATSPRSQASNPSAALTRFGRQPLTLRRLRPYAVILTALTLSVLSVIGFVVSFARDDDSATAARPRTLAVLPFQPLVPDRG